MLKILENLVDFYKLQCEDISQIKEGYMFAKDLTKDVKVRTKIILSGESNIVVNFGLLLQLFEYQLAIDDIRTREQNSYSVGMALYGFIHKKDHELLDSMYKHFARSSQSNKIKSIDDINN